MSINESGLQAAVDSVPGADESELQAPFSALRVQLAEQILGQDALIDRLLIALLAGRS